MKKVWSLLLVAALLLVSGSSLAIAAKPGTGGDSSGISIPVLCYHVVSDNPSGRYQLSTAKFQEQMAYLAANGYTTLTIDEYYSIMTLQTAPPANPVLLTFDDNTSDYYTTVYPILKQYGFHAVQFAVSDWVDTAGKMTSAQLQAVADNTSVQNHTQTHEDLSSLSYSAAYGELSTADTFLTSLRGSKPEFLAYPYGRTDTDAIAAAQAVGIKMAFTVSAGNTTPSDDFYRLNREMIVSSGTLSSFVKKLQ